MGNVDHDTQAVHLLDRKPAHFAQTAMPVNAIGFSGMGIRELVVAIMRKGHVATAHVKEFFNVGKVGTYWEGVLNSDHSYFLTRCDYLSRVIGVVGQFDLLWCDLFSQPVYRLELVDGGIICRTIAVWP